MARIRFKTTCVTSSHGSFSTGDLLVCSDEFAAHLVHDCGAAEYVASVPADLADMPVDPRIEDAAESMDEIQAAPVDPAPKRRGRPPKGE